MAVTVAAGAVRTAILDIVALGVTLEKASAFSDGLVEGYLGAGAGGSSRSNAASRFVFSRWSCSMARSTRRISRGPAGVGPAASAVSAGTAG